MNELLKKYEKILTPFLDELYTSGEYDTTIIIKNKKKYKIKIYSFGLQEDFPLEEMELHCEIEIKEYDEDNCKYVSKDIFNYYYKKK